MPDKSLLLLALTIPVSIPYVLAALGGACSERSGVVNISLEGILLGGAFGTALGAHYSGSAWVGLATGVAAGMLVSYLHALLTVTIKVDQIIAGLAINLFVGGATAYSMQLVWHADASKKIPVLPEWTILKGGAFAELVNALLGKPLVLLTIVLVPLAWLLVTKTRGVHVRLIIERRAVRRRAAR